MTHEEFQRIVESALRLQRNCANEDKREDDDLEGWTAELVELVEMCAKE